MECVCEMMPFPHPPQAHTFYLQQSQQPAIYQPYMQHPQQMEEFVVRYGAPEYAEFGYPHPAYYEEFDDMSGEPSTRPRLTKDQVEVLEAQFQANHKPSSVVKRQLAMQTMLTLPRVANWFQNRRAKAKQQKKQEEFENSQVQPSSPEVDESSVPDETYLRAEEPHGRDSPVATSSRPSTSPGSAPTPDGDTLKQNRLASYASVARLMAQQPAPPIDQPQRPVSLSRGSQQLQQPTPVYPHQRSMSAITKPELPQWSKESTEPAETWSAPPQHFQDTSFDFGFGSEDPPSISLENPAFQCIERQSGYVTPIAASAESWPHHLQMPQPLFHERMGPNGDLQSPELPSPGYHDSRRSSGTEALAANFGQFALATPVDEYHSDLDGPDSLGQPEAHMDLASRRKRPGPAALTSASLRSRSYGALTATSPTVRSGFTPPTHTVRHVKSSGANLNARFAGVRKPSSAQRSPINTSFAQAEAYHRLLLQQVGDGRQMAPTSTIGSTTPTASPGLSIDTQVPGSLDAHKAEIARSYQLAASQHLTLAASSPPATPFGPEYAAQQPPSISAQPQYAMFADYTPPYSAGPLTNSSWPDAPLTSPDISNFPAHSHSFTHLQRMSQASDPGVFHHHNVHPSQFVLPSDGRLSYHGSADSPPSHVMSKPPEFFIQEFPKQKEEHAHAAQQLPPNRPKNYVFANTAPSDYDQP